MIGIRLDQWLWWLSMPKHVFLRSLSLKLTQLMSVNVDNTCNILTWSSRKKLLIVGGYN